MPAKLDRGPTPPSCIFAQVLMNIHILLGRALAAGVLDLEWPMTKAYSHRQMIPRRYELVVAVIE